MKLERDLARPPSHERRMHTTVTMWCFRPRIFKRRYSVWLHVIGRDASLWPMLSQCLLFVCMWSTTTSSNIFFILDVEAWSGAIGRVVSQICVVPGLDICCRTVSVTTAHVLRLVRRILPCLHEGSSRMIHVQNCHHFHKSTQNMMTAVHFKKNVDYDALPFHMGSLKINIFKV